MGDVDDTGTVHTPPRMSQTYRPLGKGRIVTGNGSARLFPSRPSAVGEVRTHLRHTVPAASPDTALVVSEMATSMVRGNADSFSMSIVDGDCLRIELWDDDAAAVFPSTASGAILAVRVMDRLTSRWGMERGPGRRLVWAEIGATLHVVR